MAAGWRSDEFDAGRNEDPRGGLERGGAPHAPLGGRGGARGHACVLELGAALRAAPGGVHRPLDQQRLALRRQRALLAAGGAVGARPRRAAALHLARGAGASGGQHAGAGGVHVGAQLRESRATHLRAPIAAGGGGARCVPPVPLRARDDPFRDMISRSFLMTYTP